jgi:hypothetical protein
MFSAIRFDISKTSQERPKRIVRGPVRGMFTSKSGVLRVMPLAGLPRTTATCFLFASDLPLESPRTGNHLNDLASDGSLPHAVHV